jgi:sortase A
VPVVLLGAAGTAHASAATARLIIPRLHLDDPVRSNLADGPAFYPQSASPGTPYTVAIAGHRTTHTHPFWALNELRRGNLIILIWLGRRYVYRVSGTRIVEPTDWSAVKDVGHERLILSTCNPRFSAAQRLLVIALPVRGS